jgi:hypothetical protein
MQTSATWVWEIIHDIKARNFKILPADPAFYWPFCGQKQTVVIVNRTPCPWHGIVWPVAGLPIIG